MEKLITQKIAHGNIDDDYFYYDQKEPNGYTWFVMLLYSFTSIWFLLVAVLCFISLNNYNYIVTLIFTITICILNFIMLLFYIVLFMKGYLSKNVAKIKKVEKTHSDGTIVKHKKILNSEKMDLCSLNYSDYKSIIITDFIFLFLYFILVSITLILYSARYNDEPNNSLSFYNVNNSATNWNNSLSFICTFSFFMFLLHMVSSWKYWTLIWTSYNAEYYKNPFFPERNCFFN